MAGAPSGMEPADLERMLDETTRFWRDWLQQSTYTGRWREMVSRSAMTLKLLTYNPTGAPVAAATAALPPRAGGAGHAGDRFPRGRCRGRPRVSLPSLGRPGV